MKAGRDAIEISHLIEVTKDLLLRIKSQAILVGLRRSIDMDRAAILHARTVALLKLEEADVKAAEMRAMKFHEQLELAENHFKRWAPAFYEKGQEDAKWRELFHDKAQTGLDGAGFLPPPFGIFADVFNSGYSIYRGNVGAAAINAFAAIPFFGDGALLFLRA